MLREGMLDRLLPNPEMLLLDEPMIGLDPHAIKELKSIFAQMREDGKTLLDKTGADGVMIARAALFDPQIFCDFVGKQRRNKYEFFAEQADETLRLYGEKFATVFMRKMAAFYVKGTRGAAVFKERLFQAQTADEIMKIAEEIWG